MTDTDRTEAPPPPAPPDGSTGTVVESRRWRQRPGFLAIGGVLLLVVLAFGAAVGRYLLRDEPGAHSVDEAVEEFRAANPSADEGPVAFQRPAAGVYEAAGEGEERISTPPNSQRDGDVMPISVSHLANGCWSWHLDYNVAHWHEFDFCPQGTDLLLVGQRNFQSWDFGFMKVDNVGTYTCDPPAPIIVADPIPGGVFQHHCTGDNTAAPGPSVSEGPATIVGTEALTIDGREVATIHQTRTQAMSGTQQGTIEEVWWFAVDTGLPVRSERHYRLDTGSVIGTVSYTEDGSWQLLSMQPRT